MVNILISIKNAIALSIFTKEHLVECVKEHRYLQKQAPSVYTTHITYEFSIKNRPASNMPA